METAVAATSRKFRLSTMHFSLRQFVRILGLLLFYFSSVI